MNEYDHDAGNLYESVGLSEKEVYQCFSKIIQQCFNEDTKDKPSKSMENLEKFIEDPVQKRVLLLHFVSFLTVEVEKGKKHEQVTIQSKKNGQS